MLRRRLPLLATIRSGMHPTCDWKCGSACFRPAPNRSRTEPFQDVVARVVNRRTFLRGSAAAVVVLGAAACTTEGASPSGRPVQALAFTPIQPSTADDVVVPDGYGYEVLLRWGDPILPAPRSSTSTPRPRPPRPASSATTATTSRSCPGAGRAQALLWSNHEYTNPEMMFPDYDADTPTRDQVDIEIAAHGGSLVVVDRAARRAPGGDRAPATTAASPARPRCS